MMVALRHTARLACAVAWLVSVALAGCASAQGASSPSVRATATATPDVVTVPPIHTIKLNGYVAAYVWPTTHGVLFTGNPGTTGEQIGTAGAQALYYYDDAAQTVRTVATASPAWDGTARGIQDIVTAGDWAVYLVADAGRSHWEAWALNITTGQRGLVGSAPDHSLLRFNGGFVTDGTQVVWSSILRQGGIIEYVMAAYDLASGQSRTLLTSLQTTVIVPKAMAGGAFVFEKAIDNSAANSGLNATPDTSLWLWQLADSGPTQIATTTDSLITTMNDRYIVWDDAHANTLTLYDRATGHETDAWVVPCTRPALAETRPYLVCVDFASAYRLVRLPSGSNAAFSEGLVVTNQIGVASDRAYWVATPKGSFSSNQIAWLEMPAR
jgi:hypothetical protein